MTQIPDQLTESQAPGYLTDEQAHYWADGWNACRDRMVDDEGYMLEALQEIAASTQHAGWSPSREIALAAIKKVTGQ